MSDELIRRYAKPVPRYTSYPTAPHFHTGVSSRTYAQWLAELPPSTAISLYVHVPFCARNCWHCGCQSKSLLSDEPVAAYLAMVRKEIETVAAGLDGRGHVVALHLGGGSPSMLKPADLLGIVATIRQNFVTADALEFCLEIDPHDMSQDMSEERYDGFAAAGVNRISVSVQDFDRKVQLAINRQQSADETRAVIDGMRARGIRSANLDILYGLPHQSIDSVERTVEQALAMRPDRIALFGYAHVPWSRTQQKRIDEAALPGVAERYRQSQAAAARIRAAGYEAVGIDHFALPGDSLAEAAHAGTLHRNFQGYTTDRAPALIGIGATAMSCLPQGYVQNAASTADYLRGIAETGHAVARGIVFDSEDRVRGWVIERLMCDFAVPVAELADRFGAEADPILQEMRYAALLDGDDLVHFDGDRFAVTERGKPFVRSIASTFDTYLSAGNGRHSVAV